VLFLEVDICVELVDQLALSVSQLPARHAICPGFALKPLYQPARSTKEPTLCHVHLQHSDDLCCCWL
jgi:hypothetical protein